MISDLSEEVLKRLLKSIKLLEYLASQLSCIWQCYLNKTGEFFNVMYLSKLSIYAKEKLEAATNIAQAVRASCQS